MVKTEPAICWGLRVRLSGHGLVASIWPGRVHSEKRMVDTTVTVGRASAVRVAVVPLAEYRRLVRLDKRQGGRDEQTKESVAHQS